MYACKQTFALHFIKTYSRTHIIKKTNYAQQIMGCHLDI